METSKAKVEEIKDTISPEPYPSNLFSILERKPVGGETFTASPTLPAPASEGGQQTDATVETVDIPVEHLGDQSIQVSVNDNETDTVSTIEPGISIGEKGSIKSAQITEQARLLPSPISKDKRPYPEIPLSANPPFPTPPSASIIPLNPQVVGLSTQNFDLTPRSEPKLPPNPPPSNSYNGYSQPFSTYPRRSYDLQSSAYEQFPATSLSQQTQPAYRHSFQYPTNSSHYSYSTESNPRVSSYSKRKDVHEDEGDGDDDGNHGGSISTAGPNRGGDVGLVASLMYLFEKGLERGQEIWENWWRDDTSSSSARTY